MGAGSNSVPEDDLGAAPLGAEISARVPQRSPAQRLAPAVLALAVAGLALAGHRSLAGVLVDVFAVVVFIVLAAIDIERRTIPNRIVLPAAAVILVGRLAQHPSRWDEFLLAALGAALVLLLPSLINRSAIGMGDVKLGLLMGATLGWKAVAAIPIALLCAGLVAATILLRGGRSARGSTIPLAPFLAIGALVAVLTLPRL